MNYAQERIQEEFDRESETLRGVGGMVSGEDLRAHGERMAYAAIGPWSYFTVGDARLDAEMRFWDAWDRRHDAEFGDRARGFAKEAVAELRKLKGRDKYEILTEVY